MKILLIEVDMSGTGVLVFHFLGLVGRSRGRLFKINDDVNVSIKFKTYILQIHCYFC